MSYSDDTRNPDFSDLGAINEFDILMRARRALVDRLPAGWSAEFTEDTQSVGRGVDALLTITAADGATAVVAVEAKRILDTRDARSALQQLRRGAEIAGARDAVPLLAARYLAPATREAIIDAGAGYADATGNIYLALERPALFVRDAGAARDPWRGRGRPRNTLKGAPAAKVVRALVDFAPPYSVADLAERARASMGATYRVVELAEGEQLLEREREGRGAIVEVAWRRLLERWSEDYVFEKVNTVGAYLEPRGMEAFLERLRTVSELTPYVVTGSLAAQRKAPYAEAKTAVVYIPDRQVFAAELGVRAVDRGANVLLATNESDVIYQRAERDDGIVYAAPSQVAVDLLTGPGRNPSEGQALLDWMEGNEDDWRA